MAAEKAEAIVDEKASPSAMPETPTQASGDRTTYIMFAIVTITCALGSLTQTVMNSMLLSVQESFATTENVSQWLTTIYMLVIGITVPIVTHLSRKLSIRSLTLISLAFFLAGSLIDLVAPDFLILLLGRIPQAIATGITLPLLNTIAMVRFPKGKNGTAMGIAGIAMGFAPNIGPLIGGALVMEFTWRSFYVILSIALVAMLVLSIILIAREKAPAHDARLDIISFLESTIGFGGLLLGFTNAASVGITDIWVLIQIAVGILFLVLFVLRQNRVAEPLISMRIFRTSDFTVSFIAQNCLFASFMGITLIIPLFVQNVGGYSALDAGIVFIPATILAVIFNPLAGILCDQVGARPVTIVAGLFLTAGAVSMIFVDADTPLWLLTLMQTIRGIGVSSLIGPLISWGMAKLPFDVMMDGSAFSTTVRQACASFGTALMMLVISMVTVSVGAGALGYQLAFALSAVLSVAVFAIALFRIR